MKYYVFFIVSFFCLQAKCQKIINYTTEDGLPNDIVYNIHQDENGYLWFGTDDGLVKYNGTNFTNYTTKNGLFTNYVIDIKQYNKDSLAIATWGGGLHFFSKDTITKAILDDFMKINELVVFDKDIYSYYGNNTFIFEKNSTDFKENKISVAGFQIQNILADETTFSPRFTVINDTLLFHSNFKSYQKSKNFKGVFYATKNRKLKPFFSLLQNKIINTIIPYNNNFIAAEQDKIIVLDRKTILLEEKLPISNRNIIKIIPFKENELLLLAADEKSFKELYSFHLKTKKLINFREKYTINFTISDVALDFENNIWFTTNGNGIYQIQDTNFAIKTIFEGENISKITFFDNKIYALSPKNIISVDSENSINKIGLEDFGKGMHTYKNKLYVSSYTKVDTIQLTQEITEINGLFNYKDDGLTVSGQQNLFINGKLEKRIPNSVNHILQTESKIYLSTGLGLYQLDKYTNDVVSSNFKELRNTQVTKVIPENDYLWVATNKGLVKLFEDKVEKFTTQEGLLSNSIRDILITKDKKLWIATSKGVSIFDGITFVNITKEDNLISNNVSSLTLDNTGNVFIGTTAGISVFEKSEKIIEQKPPILNVFQSDTSFNFDAISYNSSSSLFVQYQINNQPWVTTTLNTISFKNFKEGYYTFRVRAKKPNSTWQYSKDYNFSVVIPIYKKRIFIVVIVLVLISIITLFVIYQLQKSKKFNRNLVRAMNEQKKLEKRLNTVRENIAQDFHDDLGNKLASITVLTDILSNKNISTDDKKIVYQIQENSDSLYKGTKDFIWSLNSKSDRLEELVTYLSDFGEEFFHKMNISFTIKKDIKSNIALPYYWSRHLILIFKEAMTNVAKHAKAKECEIQFFCDSAILNITLIDDGIGFLQSENTAHNGLINMKKRAKKINANLTISSSKKGTKISFHTKLPKQGS